MKKNNTITDILMEAKMPIVSRLNCILSQATYYSKFTSNNTLCAGFRNGISVCNGDSGGGLIFPKTGTSGVDTVWELRGIVSNTFGKDGICDPDYYVIFTDAAKYLDWIKDIIKK
ncbi:hypothetical protein NQ317_013365 [Molorchus minor]|uniref:Peptidase S1 domain-containing protein n=1 Tax=Molorchus minor TaxID=1323400 RepID=A0ABQ9J2R5_9CUCU|nr:hypothetical protein NQ317_013365 [Molorchus minor]